MHAEGGSRSRWTLKILPCFRPEEDLIERLREKKSSEEGERDLENRSALRDCIRSDKRGTRRFRERDGCVANRRNRGNESWLEADDDDIGGSISRSGILPFVLIIDANDFSRPLPILALIIQSDLADFLPLLHRQNYVVGHNMTSPSTSQSYNLQFFCLFERVDGYNEVK